VVPRADFADLDYKNKVTLLKRGKKKLFKIKTKNQLIRQKVVGLNNA
jgi:hypothetical protein